MALLSDTLLLSSLVLMQDMSVTCHEAPSRGSVSSSDSRDASVTRAMI